MIALKLLVLIVRIFVGNPKICLSSSFANTCVPPETPQKGILFLGHPVHGSGIIPTPIPVSVSVAVSVLVLVWIISLVLLSVWMISLVSVLVWWYRWNTRIVYVLNFWLFVQKLIHFAPVACLVTFFLLRLPYIKLGQNSYGHIKSSFYIVCKG